MTPSKCFKDWQADQYVTVDQNQVFDLNTTFASSMLMDISDTFYTGWQPVRINAGDGPSDPDGNSGFWINGSGLQWSKCFDLALPLLASLTPIIASAPDAPPDSEANAFAGWLVCDWCKYTTPPIDRIPILIKLPGHGVPQLFFRLDYDTKYPAPCSCAEVYLCPEYI